MEETLKTTEDSKGSEKTKRNSKGKIRTESITSSRIQQNKTKYKNNKTKGR